MLGGSYKIARVYGIPIKVHLTLLLVLPIMALDFGRALGPGQFLWGVLAAVGLFTSIALHELGHSIVAIRKGCRVREILLLPIGGVAQLESMPRRPRDEFHVAIAGPAVSLALAAIGRFGGAFLAASRLYAPARVLLVLGSINFMLVLFNLLPSFPMDGGRVFRAWLTPKLGRLAATAVAAKVGRFMAILFGMWGLFTWNIFLILIAVFIYQAAGAEYRMVRMQEAARTPPMWPPWAGQQQPMQYDEDEVTVSPPPYERSRPASSTDRPLKAQRDLFDDLFQNWR